jgi:hypothetical protein
MLEDDIKQNNNNSNLYLLYSAGWALAPSKNVASDLYPGHLPADFYNPFPSCLPLPCPSILILVGHTFTGLHGLSMISF